MAANYTMRDYDFDELRNFYIKNISKRSLIRNFINLYGKQEVFKRAGDILSERGFFEEDFEDPPFVLYLDPKNVLPLSANVTVGGVIDLHHENSAFKQDGFYKSVKIIEVTSNYFSVDNDDIHFGYPMQFWNVGGKYVNRMYAKMLELSSLPKELQFISNYHIGGFVAILR